MVSRLCLDSALFSALTSIRGGRSAAASRPRSVPFARVVKRGRYQRAGIEDWIVDLARFFDEVLGPA